MLQTTTGDDVVAEFVLVKERIPHGIVDESDRRIDIRTGRREIIIDHLFAGGSVVRDAQIIDVGKIVDVADARFQAACVCTHRACSAAAVNKLALKKQHGLVGLKEHVLVKMR